MYLNEPYASIVRKFTDLGRDTAIFGGFVRDILYTGATPRDIDLVVKDASVGEIFGVFEPNTGARTNVFGGVKGHLLGVEVDAWPLETTLAFKNDSKFAPTFENVPKTSFFNIEAAVLVFDIYGNQSLIDHGMREAWETKVLDVNYEVNPFPLACLVRAAVFAHRYNLSFGPKLQRYVTEHPITAGKLNGFRKQHYKGIYDMVDVPTVLAAGGVTSQKSPSSF